MKVKDNQRTKLDAYAWPGGYPIMYLAHDGWREDNGKLDFTEYDRTGVCCAKCATDIKQWPNLIIVAQYIHWEGESEYCEWCNGFTESAYGVPEADKPEPEPEVTP